jgi:hypothetical protein
MPKGEKLSIAFIDGMHEEEAAKKDYRGLIPFIDKKTVVLWHNTYSVRNTFKECFDPSLFDRSHILHTYGVMGIYFNSAEHPGLEGYLKQHSLIWNDWEANLLRLTRKDAGHPSLNPKRYIAEVVRRLRVKSAA